MFTKKRGRPPGRTAEGRRMRERLFLEAVGLIRTRGYEGATLRDVARRAGVSAGLMYRYFPSKRAVLLELYERLSAELEARAARTPRGRWRRRATWTLRASLDVLRPHRGVLAALVPVLVGDAEEGIFAERTAFSRRRVHGAFAQAVAGAVDAPEPRLSEALGRALYLGHLAVVLWWLLDRSPAQRATARLVSLFGRLLDWAPWVLRFGAARRPLLAFDNLIRQALWRP